VNFTKIDRRTFVTFTCRCSLSRCLILLSSL